jgi:hypothetical protein
MFKFGLQTEKRQRAEGREQKKSQLMNLEDFIRKKCLPEAINQFEVSYPEFWIS